MKTLQEWKAEAIHLRQQFDKLSAAITEAEYDEREELFTTEGSRHIIDVQEQCIDSLGETEGDDESG